MYIRDAKKEDAVRIMEIIDGAKESLKTLGIDQWQNGYPNMDSTLRDIENGVSRVLTDEYGNIIATAAVYIGNEPTYNEIHEGSWLRETDTYGIIHRIAVDTTNKNKGMASMIMTYCAELTKSAGLSSLRCDTHLGNVIMQHTLEKNGYKRCGIIYLEDGSPRVGYEKLLSSAVEGGLR